MNFKHLHYFWVAARAGGIVRAGEQLHTTPQTLSGQIKLLESSLGVRLFRKRGRQLELTDEGRLALGYADQIFALGSDMQNVLGQAQESPTALEFRVGVAESVAKSVVYRLLEPTLSIGRPIRLICSEGKFPELLAQMALNRLDLVIAEEPITSRTNIKAFNHPLGSSPMSFYGTPAVRARLKGEFPQCLDGAPMLVMGTSASIRKPLEAWLTKYQIKPRMVGEFDDGTLMKTFGREGRGVFMAASVLDKETVTQYGVQAIGHSDEIMEHFYAVSVERRVKHPCVVAITQAARKQLAMT
ncbi:MAG: transcriptional activator NhaR [Polaromonas sp.]|uniref:transcriptional activator NhaR n=1 Tax=Polaromonas sp. TaxID=1869339 RepID=UPI0025D9C027|nr:transcriptional activator NhaR [Polaromonas sp.]MBI2725970.1 transcriptional activator NhaR [Polaromonas sp.]